MKSITIQIPDSIYDGVERRAAARGATIGQEVVALLQHATNGQDEATLIAARARMTELFGAVKGFRQTPRISREELYGAEVFVDTNVFLYSVDDEPASLAKRDLARQLLLSERWGWSTQVAAEFFVNATSAKRKFRMSSADAAAFVETWLAYPTQLITADLVRAAINIHQRFQLSYWDAAILAAAKQLGCGTVYSEDLNHGQDYDGVRVSNPFLSVATTPSPQ